MSDIDRFAQQIRARDNPAKLGVQIGKIIGENPFVVELAEGKIHGTDGKNLFIADHLLKGYQRLLRSGAVVTLFTQEQNTIKAGDRVIVLVSDDNTTMYVVARTGGIV